jgi:APA family basic amino acid/polyamine antiporter
MNSTSQDDFMENEPEKTSLLARLSLFDATLLVIGSVIGSGIFLTTGIIAKYLPSAEWIIFVWIFGALLSLFGGLTFAELGAMIPEAGGQYVYLREAYGPMAGFMYGWTAFIITQTGGIAALAVGFAEYLAYFIPPLGLDVSFMQIANISISSGQIVALGSIIILTIVNYYGIKSGSFVQNILTLIKLLAIAILICAGIYVFVSSGESAGVNMPPEIPPNQSIPVAIGIALIAVLWTFDGWYSVNTIASEIKNVKKNLPLSLIIGITLIGTIYFLINLFYLNTLPMEKMMGVVRIGEYATGYAFGPFAGTLMAGLILISILGCLSATILFGPRIYFAMARDGLFFKSFSKIHTKYHTPTVAILWQGGLAGLLCLTGTYEELFTYVTFAVLLFFIGTVSAVFVLRWRRAEAERPYRVWGYPLVPAIFGLTIFWIMINTLIEKPVEALVGLVIITIGLPVYFYWKGRLGRF